MTYRSRTYRISRLTLARLSAMEYVREFWWFVAIIPFFGLVALIFGRGVLQVIGGMALLWPASIPARGVIASNRATRMFQRGVWVLLEDDTLYFHGEDGHGMKLELASVRAIIRRGPYVLLKTRRLGLVAIAREAIDEDFEAALKPPLLA